VIDHVEYLKVHSLLKAKRDRMLENHEQIPEDMYVVGELTRRDRPAMGVKR
jgi:2-oxoglutarate ferredoxin oxidoreductase subunit beta